MSRYLLSIGSNAPGANGFMARAERWLAENFADIVSSGVYRSPALNGRSADYLNMVAEVTSGLSVSELTAACKRFETECGRTARSKELGAVEMDVDLISAGNVILRPAEYTRPYFLRGLALLPICDRKPIRP